MRSPGGRPHQTDRVHLSPDLVSGPASSTPRRGARTVAAPVPPRAPVLSPPQTTARAATSLSSSVPQSLQTVVDLAARLTGCQYAAINLVSRHHQHSVVAAGGGPRELPREDSLCATVLDEPGLVVVEDTRLDARMQDLRWVDPERGGTIGFYASVPLHSPQGRVLGRLCVLDPEPRTGQPARVAVLEDLGRLARQILEESAATPPVEATLPGTHQMLSTFAEQVSLELRTPLTSMVLQADLLAASPVVMHDAHLRRIATGIAGASRRLGSMLAEVVAFAQEGSDLTLTSVDLHAVAADVLDRLRLSGALGDVPVLLGRLPVVRGDEARLRAVLVHLVNVALQHHDLADDSAALELAAVRGQDTWRISLGFAGRRLPAENRDSVFDLYARIESAAPGTGVPLAAVKRIVEAHGGRVGLSDRSRRRTQLWFELPARRG